MTAPAPAMRRRTVTRRMPRAGLDGGALPVRAWLLLAAGTAGGLVFTGVYLAEGATRAGYRALAQPISALSPGPGGWVQQLNFILFGVLVLLSAAGWRAALAPGQGRAGVPGAARDRGRGPGDGRAVCPGSYRRVPAGCARGDADGARAGAHPVRGDHDHRPGQRVLRPGPSVRR